MHKLSREYFIFLLWRNGSMKIQLVPSLVQQKDQPLCLLHQSTINKVSLGWLSLKPILHTFDIESDRKTWIPEHLSHVPKLKTWFSHFFYIKRDILPKTYFPFPKHLEERGQRYSKGRTGSHIHNVWWRRDLPLYLLLGLSPPASVAPLFIPAGPDFPECSCHRTWAAMTLLDWFHLIQEWSIFSTEPLWLAL